MVAARDGRKSSAKLPIDYLYFVWRKKMKMPYQPDDIPVKIMLKDLEYLELEAQYLTPKEATNKNG